MAFECSPKSATAWAQGGEREILTQYLGSGVYHPSIQTSTLLQTCKSNFMCSVVFIQIKLQIEIITLFQTRKVCINYELANENKLGLQFADEL